MASQQTTPLVQYIVLRGDLLSHLKWSVGALVAQACHASTAVMHQTREDPLTVEYLDDVDSMHKVILKAPDEESVVKLSERLKHENIQHKLWVEQPENVVTCLAVKPYRKAQVQAHFKDFKLFR